MNSFVVQQREVDEEAWQRGVVGWAGVCVGGWGCRGEYIPLSKFPRR